MLKLVWLLPYAHDYPSFNYNSCYEISATTVGSEIILRFCTAVSSLVLPGSEDFYLKKTELKGDKHTSNEVASQVGLFVGQNTVQRDKKIKKNKIPCYN